MGPSGEWDRSDYFSAHILDSINFNNYLTAIGNWQQHGKGDPPKPPTPIEKPTDAIVEEVEPAAFLTAAEMRAWKVDVQTPTVVLNE